MRILISDIRRNLESSAFDEVHVFSQILEDLKLIENFDDLTLEDAKVMMSNRIRNIWEYMHKVLIIVILWK
jgi:hypothetical protein